MKELDKNAATYRKRPAGEVSDIPSELAITTLNSYKYALSLYQKGNAYLMSMDEKFMKHVYVEDDGYAYYDYEEIRTPLTEDDFRDHETFENIGNFNFTLLRMIYSIVLEEYENSDYQSISTEIRVYIPDLYDRLGVKANRSQKQIDYEIEKLDCFKNLIGVLKDSGTGRTYTKFYRVLQLKFYDEKSNTVSLTAPYMGFLVKRIHEESVRKTAKGDPKISSSGKISLLPSHSYLIKPDIGKERNLAAVENVVVIVALIVTAGKNDPHIKARTLIDRNPYLRQQLTDQKCSKNRQRVLDRAFIKTWELLREETYLYEKYPNIKFPDPECPPKVTVKALDMMVLNFPYTELPVNVK